MVEQESKQNGNNFVWSLSLTTPLNTPQDCGPDVHTGAISIEDIGGVFIVIFFGIMLAMITLALEYWYYKFRAAPKSAKEEDTETKKVAEYDEKN